MVGQRLCVVDQPDLGGQFLTAVAGSLAQRLAGQHLIEARDQGFGVGRKVDLDAVLGRCTAQAQEQLLNVVVQQGLVNTGQRQAQTFVGHRIDATFHPHAIGRSEEKVVQTAVVGVDRYVHAVARALEVRWPLVSKSMVAGSWTRGFWRGVCPGTLASRLNT